MAVGTPKIFSLDGFMPYSPPISVDEEILQVDPNRAPRHIGWLLKAAFFVLVYFTAWHFVVSLEVAFSTHWTFELLQEWRSWYLFGGAGSLAVINSVVVGIFAFVCFRQVFATLYAVALVVCGIACAFIGWFVVFTSIMRM